MSPETQSRAAAVAQLPQNPKSCSHNSNGCRLRAQGDPQTGHGHPGEWMNVNTEYVCAGIWLARRSPVIQEILNYWWITPETDHKELAELMTSPVKWEQKCALSGGTVSSRNPSIICRDTELCRARSLS